MTLAGSYRLPVLHQEFHQRHPCEWTTLAENQWTHDGRKLTALQPRSGFAPEPGRFSAGRFVSTAGSHSSSMFTQTGPLVFTQSGPHLFPKRVGLERKNRRSRPPALSLRGLAALEGPVRVSGFHSSWSAPFRDRRWGGAKGPLVLPRTDGPGVRGGVSRSFCVTRGSPGASSRVMPPKAKGGE